MNDKRQEVLRFALELYQQKKTDWMVFFRDVRGPDGMARKAFSEGESFTEFEKSDEHQQIQQMLAKLREKTPESAEEDKEPTRVITVRLPKCLHEALKLEAHDRNTSMNKLCISKLLQVVDDELVPVEAGSGAEA